MSNTNTRELNEKVRIDNEAEERTLLGLFPNDIKNAIEVVASSAGRTLIEIVIDTGRAPLLVFIDGTHEELDGEVVMDMEPFVRSVLAKSQRNDFSRDNRIGIEVRTHVAVCSTSNI